MEKTRNKVKPLYLIAGLLFALLSVLIVSFFQYKNILSNNVLLIKYENDIQTIFYNDIPFYRTSYTAVEKSVYDEQTYKRLKNFGIDTNGNEDYYYAFYNDKSFLYSFLKDKIYKTTLFGNTVLFNLSEDNDIIYAKSNIQLPNANKNNVYKIVFYDIGLKGKKTIVLDNDIKLTNFFDNPNKYIERCNKQFDHFVCLIYYNNSDENIYEAIDQNDMDEFIEYNIS